MARPSVLRRIVWIGAAGIILEASAFADYTATGRFQYEDREFDMNGITGVVTPRPIRHADVRIMAGNQTLATGATAEDGTFSIPVPSSTAGPVAALCVTSSNNTPGLLLEVRVARNDYSFGDLYSVSSETKVTSGSGIVNFVQTVASAGDNGSPGKFFNIWDVIIDGMQFVASPGANGTLPVKKLTVLWRLDHPDDGSFFVPGAVPYLFVGAAEAYDDTVISHEFGHFIDYMFSHSDSPGGQHFLGDNTQDMRLAWSEGLATYLGCYARLYHGYNRPEIYVNTDGTALSFSYELEYLTGSAIIASKTGSTNEIAVSAALWDAADGRVTRDSTPGIDDDLLDSIPFSEVWADLTRYFPSVTRPGITVETFWDGWFSPAVNNGFLNEMRNVFADVNGIEFLPDAQEPDDSPSAAPVAATTSVPKPRNRNASVVINELDLGSVDEIELYNAGDAQADMTGWRVQASAPGYPAAVLTVPAFKLPPGGFVILSEATGVNTNSTLYFGRNISWSNGTPGACALWDSDGAAVDFVRWGGSQEPVPAGTGFAGPDPASPPPGKTLGRDFLGTDTNSGSDWSAQIPTFGTYNASGAERHHTFYPAGDVDFTAFYAVAGRCYLVETLNLFNGADTIVDVISSDGFTVLASNDDYGAWDSSRLEWLAPASGKYYVRSRRFDGPGNFAQYGSYDLRIMESTSGFGLPLPALLTVSQPGQGGNFTTLSQALAAAANGDTVQILDSGTYVENLTILNRSVTLRSSPGKRPVLDGRSYAGSPALNIVNGKSIRIEGITVLGGARGIQINGGNVTILNTVVNAASDPGGGSDGIRISGLASEVVIVNCTIVNNGRFGVEVQNSGPLKVANSIFQNNAGGDIDSVGGPQVIRVKNSLLGTKAYAGNNGNASGDPQFVTPGSDFRLRAGSIAIDKGDPADADLPAFDADGLPRSIDGMGSGKPVPDLGAYEYLPPGYLGTVAVFPQIAAGSYYQTSIFAVNTGAVQAAINVSLTRSDASPFPAGSLDGVGNEWLSIHPQGTTDRRTAASNRLLAGYATFLSNIPVQGGALIRRVTADRISSEAAVGLSKPTGKFTVYVDNTAAAFTGYAVANFGTADANLTLTLRDSAGNPRDTPKAITLRSGQHVSEFAFERFPAAQVGFEGTIEFSSDPQVAAVALRYDNVAQDTFTTVPVLLNEGSARTLYFPQVADGGGYRTDIILLNPSETATKATLEFFGDDGSLLALPVGGALTKSYEISIAAHGVTHVATDGSYPDITVGWLRVTSTVALGGSAIFQTVLGATITSEAGVPSSPPAAHFVAYVESLGSAASGVAICNPNAGEVPITLNLRNQAGQTVATTSMALKPLGHVARFFSGAGQWFPRGFDQFQGTLELIAGKEVSVVALRYDNDDASVFATLPVVVVP